MAETRAESTASSSQLGWDDFAPLYEEHNARLYRVALLLCHGSKAMAEDAVAETFVRVYRAWSQGGVDNFFGYARRALVNHVMGQFRSQQVADRYAGVFAADDRGALAVEDAILDTSTVFQTLQQLPPRQRTAVVLRYYEDLSYEQIATTMEVSVGTAKAQVSLGLSRMRTLLGSRDGDGDRDGDVAGGGR